MLKALLVGNIALASHSTIWAWWAAGFTVLSILLYFLALCCSHLAAFRTATNMKKAAMHHIVALPLGYFSQNASGRLRKVIDDNAGLTENFLAHQLPDLTGAVVMPVSVLVPIFVLDGGIVAERGTHEELMKQKGRYARLVNLQTASAEWKLQKNR